MKFLTLIIVITLTVVAQDSDAQLTKAEKKALQKEIKDYQKDPAKYKAFKQALEEKKEYLSKLDRQITELNEAIAQGQDKMKEKEQRVKQLTDEIARLRSDKSETEKIIKTNTNEEGILYKVQVPIDEASLYQEVSEIDGKPKPIFSGEQDEDGTKKYTLGFFKEKSDADTFCQYLKMLRIKDAVVIMYKDGKRTK